MVTNLARLLNHGVLAGTGKLVILPVDQGFEHGPARSFAANPPAYDPVYHFELAMEARCNAYAAPLAFIEAGARAFAGEIPLILKVNDADSLRGETDPAQALTGGGGGFGFDHRPQYLPAPARQGAATAASGHGHLRRREGFGFGTYSSHLPAVLPDFHQQMMGRAVQALARQGVNGLIVLGGDHLQLGSRETFVVDEEEIDLQEVSDASFIPQPQI